ncbi:hypothetical protein [Tenacibaculum sp. 190524A02b]|uniref:hypothetical protein n=1 Tax=Tenacibaculum vairaonense TaxID=3137860 RepID=UPI0031FA5274
MKDINKQQVENAIKKLIEWFPEETENLEVNKELIVNYFLDKNKPVHPTLKEIKHVTVKDQENFDTLSLTACEEAIAIVVVDVIMFVFGLVGLHISNQERLTRSLIRKLGPSTLRGFSRAVHNFSVAKGAMAKSKALFALMGGIWKAGGFKAAFKIAKDEMTWWEWVKTGTIAVVQITAWFATDGIAFIAEAALVIMSAEQLIEDAIKAGKVC